METLLDELKNCLSGMKDILSSKGQSTVLLGHRRRKRKRSEKRKGRRNKSEESGSDGETADEPVAKRSCLRTPDNVKSATTETPSQRSLHGDESASQITLKSRKSQLVVGTNAVTRCLEEGALRVGVVCLTAKPALVHRHILQLAATRRVPVAALPNLSPTIAPLLGLKSTLAIGIKVCF